MSLSRLLSPRLTSCSGFSARMASHFSSTAAPDNANVYPASLKVALCQIPVTSDKQINIKTASDAIDAAAATHASLVVLPECWNSPYSTAAFPDYAEVVPNVGHAPIEKHSPSVAMMCEKAQGLKKWIVGGSVPEREGENIYNTCVVINDNGEIVAKHRKAHLFDIDIPGKITFKESDSLKQGESATIVQSPWGRIGVGICYDIRFPEYAALLRRLGARLLVYPGAFNMITGPAHWELLQRARAVDNQVFVLACSPAREEGGGYVAWGHSTVVSPWGEIVASCEAGPAIVEADLDLTSIDTMRQNIPCWKQKRDDLY